MASVQFEPIRALRAARRLAADPDDLPQVFTIIESLAFNTLERTVRRMAADPRGRPLLSARPDIVQKLSDRAALSRLPEGSLGRAYLEFVERENISAEGIRVAAEQGMRDADALPAPLDWMSRRMRDTHDLWHVVTGYSGDVLGETSLLAFTFTQTWSPGVALILAIGLVKTLGGLSARRTILDGFMRGLRSEWLPAQDWEGLLALPLLDVRTRLSIGEPPVYTPISSAEIKAA